MIKEASNRLARDFRELMKLQERFITKDEITASIKAYRPKSTDIVISPASKCGTTWLQQIFHTLRTHGDMNYDDISRVVPWIETASALQIDLNAPQRAEPRGFKCHSTYDQVPKGARYIVSLRDPKDAIASLHRFMEGWFLEPGAVTLDAWVEIYLSDKRTVFGYWQHLLSWWGVRSNSEVLLISYEHMSEEPEFAIRAIAKFCGITLTDELLDLTLERSSLTYMLEHNNRFDDKMMRELSEWRCNLPSGANTLKVRNGKVGAHRQEMSSETISALETQWRRAVTPTLGFPDYASLESDLRKFRTS